MGDLKSRSRFLLLWFWLSTVSIVFFLLEMGREREGCKGKGKGEKRNEREGWRERGEMENKVKGR